MSDPLRIAHCTPGCPLWRPTFTRHSVQHGGCTAEFPRRDRVTLGAECGTVCHLSDDVRAMLPLGD